MITVYTFDFWQKARRGIQKITKISFLEICEPVRLIFVTKLDFYYLVNIITKLIDITEEKTKTEPHAETNT